MTTKIEGLPDNNQRLVVRLMDLVRHQREELYAAKLISSEEHADLVPDPGTLYRFETYESLIQELKDLHNLNLEAANLLEKTAGELLMDNSAIVALVKKLRDV